MHFFYLSNTRTFLFLALVLILKTNQLLWAQTGDYFLTHHAPALNNIDHHNYQIIQDQQGVICVANRRGVMRYDGKSWEFIQTPSSIFSLAADNNNTLYIGSRLGFGYLQKDRFGKDLYYSLSNDFKEGNDITHTLIHEEMVYFLNSKNIFIYAPSQDKIIAHIQANENQAFSNIFKLESQIVVDSEKQLLTISNDKLIPLANPELNQHRWTFISEHPTKPIQLLGSLKNELFILEKGNLKPVHFENQEYLTDSEIVSGLWLNDSLAAIGTLRGGCIFLNLNHKQISQIVNYHTGLPDNEVLAMFKDKDHGVWIAHHYGFTRIAPQVPFRNFSHFPGLEGNLLAVEVFRNQLYVATSLGVYYLAQVKDYNEIEYLVKVPKKKAEVIKSQTKTAVQENATIQNEKEKKGLFSFLKKKKSQTDQEPPEEAPQQEKNNGFFSSFFGPKNKTVPTDTLITETRVKRELQAIRYVFKKVPGIDNSKCKQIIAHNNHLFASGLGGVFEIKNHKAYPITTQPIHYLFASKANNRLIASTLSQEILIFDFSEGSWQSNNLLKNFREPIQHINQDHNHNLWLCSSDAVYRLSLKNNIVEQLQKFPITNEYFGNISSVMHQKRPCFINSSGYFQFLKNSPSLLEDNSLKAELDQPIKHLQSRGISFIFNGKQWRCIGENIIQPLKLDFLSLFHDINFVSISDDLKSLWVINGENKLYKLDMDATANIFSKNFLFLKELKDKQGKPLPLHNLVLNQNNSYLSFEFIQPDYLGIMGIEYQYLLEGLTEDWSQWTNNNSVSFHYLPNGDYTLRIRTKNAFNQIYEGKPFSFKVVPPYWQTSWFYALEVLFFGSLLLLAIRLNRKNNKNQLLTRLLTYLTLILIIEFLQVTIENQLDIESTPVIDFFVQTTIALMILPIEQKLRKVLIKKNQIEETRENSA
jgi:ligand-binding sensor domain-containing protein